MNARETLERHARRIPGGIAWERAVFHGGHAASPSELIDTAVDIAWECLIPENAPATSRLDIRERGDLLVIRLAADRDPVGLPLAA